MLRPVFLIVLLLALPTGAADWYVNNVTGDDQATGQSAETALHTINLAVRKSQPGDTIHLAATGVPYRQAIDFYEHAGGEEGKPITVDGHGALLSGADPCPPEGWEPYQGETLKRQDSVAAGFILLDGEMTFGTRDFNVIEPGEFCYMWKRVYFHVPQGMKLAEQTIEVGQPDGTTVTLEPGKWQRSHSRIGAVRRYNGLKRPTWVKLNGEEKPLVLAQDRLQPGQWAAYDKTMYFRPPAGQTPAELTIECVVRGNGVQMNGKTKYVIFRNLNVQHVYNDGYNIHGAVTHTEFYNCNAWQCGDEGFSAHDACETILDGAYYDQCDNGIANVNLTGYSITRNVLIRRSRHVGVLFEARATRTAKHTLENAILVDNPSQLSGGNVFADNVLILRTAEGPGNQALALGRECSLERVTALGNGGLLRTGVGAKLSLANVLFGPGQGVIHVRADETAGLITFRRLRFAPDLKMQWGSKYPWQEQPLAEWLAATPGHEDTAPLPPDVDWPGIVAGNPLPEGLTAGCSAELWQRWRDSLADQAEDQ